MFKKLVKSIAAIKTEGDRNSCFAQIDRAFDAEKILLGRPRNAVQSGLDGQCGGLNDEVLL